MLAISLKGFRIMSTYPICSECGEVLEELEEREAEMCEECQKELELRNE